MDKRFKRISAKEADRLQMQSDEKRKELALINESMQNQHFKLDLRMKAVKYFIENGD